ncbi:hypothetical protein [Kushneria aurantia]
MAGGYDLKGKYVSWMELSHFRLIKREAERQHLEMAGEDCGRTSASYVHSGELHDPDKQRLAEIIERDEALMAQAHTPGQDQMRHGLFLNKVTDAVFDALSDHEKLSMPLLEDKETGRQFALLILKLLWQERVHVMCSQGSNLSILQVIRAAICSGPKDESASGTKIIHEACDGVA